MHVDQVSANCEGLVSSNSLPLDNSLVKLTSNLGNTLVEMGTHISDGMMELPPDQGNALVEGSVYSFKPSLNVREDGWDDIDSPKLGLLSSTVRRPRAPPP